MKKRCQANPTPEIGKGLRKRLLLFVFVLCNASMIAAQDNVLVIKASRVIDGVRQVPIENAVVIVRGSKIEAVGPANQIKIPAGATVVDLPGHTVLPGLIDTHEHPTVRP